MDYKSQFYLPEGRYLLNHSVGRPLLSAKAGFEADFWRPWCDSGREPWGHWLNAIEAFREALARLFDGDKADFCPQVNLSSALTKLLMSHPRLNRVGARVLMCEEDFPSMGFAVQKALPKAQIRFIPQGQDLTDANVWQQYLDAELDLVFISHAFSNLGVLAPVADIVGRCRELGVLSLVDVAQSAGVVPLSLTELAPDFLIGSSVKWLCGGPGAAYLWVNPVRINECEPIDVGWFSHENPFEFNIHHFQSHPSALKFWGGTPSVAPFVLASHSINWFANLGEKYVRAHNQALVSMLYDLMHQYGASDSAVSSTSKLMVSTVPAERRSGTAILDFGDDNDVVMARLSEANISVDKRRYGLRVSPHLYNDGADIAAFIDCVQGALKR
ncbi:aminotransferase class V-fold PLP-dependent enzyme [Shewanella sp. JM162201]|uniref:Aminotransferase class V-fold PLP-dependent enzyme n=1 Tax=Shewanella jiangmenensis TaxID=2837387 RepID=A0ABS5V483_9GAMM|nr:aminotransferase class V-fold PLP-dependent enzyme [Shewanella jiangmenensis]MBT1445270.1 aminotransferase class V-fold PLP-dependent enzyme [Shewanella jiangmenensis]